MEEHRYRQEATSNDDGDQQTHLQTALAMAIMGTPLTEC